MCGITGFAMPDNTSQDDLEFRIRKMCTAMSHRGPDGEGYWCDHSSGVAFGHRRLSIVDLSPTGAQPMHSRCGRLAMVYNGEVYNAPELSKELVKSGAQFKGTSDSEVILEGFSQWGIEPTLEKLIGMFAIAIWNKETRELCLIRDRLGIKPLFWTHTEGGVIFASELKALIQHPSCNRALNEHAMSDFLRRGYIRGSSAIYKNVNKLTPGKILRFRINGQPKINSFWSLTKTASDGHKNQFKGSFTEATESLKELIIDAVNRRMIADVPLGSFLSGGIDSSLIAAVMQSQTAQPVKTFSIGFHEAKYNEAPHAAKVAEYIGSEHTELYVSSDDAINVIPDLPIIYDEPFSDPSQIPTFLLSKLTREHVTVALSGDGGDELFAGYERYFTADKFSKILRQPKLLRQLEARIIESISPATASKLGQLLPSRLGKHLTGHKLERIPPALRDGKLVTLYDSILSHKQNTSDAFNWKNIDSAKTEWDHEAADFTDNISMMQFIDTSSYLPDDILTKVDRASMAASLEARVPLIDHRIVEFSWRLPINYKVQGGTGKSILRELLYQYVPRNIIERPKMGFSVPIGQWLRGPIKPWAEDLLSRESLMATDVFDIKYVQSVWQQHQKGLANWEYHLWDILNLQSWLLKNK